MKNTTTALTSENTVLQALAKGACPICALVRAYQNETIERLNSSGVKSVCNYHAWAVAASAPAAEVASMFLRMLESRIPAQDNGSEAEGHAISVACCASMSNCDFKKLPVRCTASRSGIGWKHMAPYAAFMGRWQRRFRRKMFR